MKNDQNITFHMIRPQEQIQMNRSCKTVDSATIFSYQIVFTLNANLGTEMPLAFFTL